MDPVRAIILDDIAHYGEKVGQILPRSGSGPTGYSGLFVTCPNCGERYRLTIPPFSWDPKTITIGPASIRLGCGFHGRVKNGEWELWGPGDHECQQAAGSKLFS